MGRFTNLITPQPAPEPQPEKVEDKKVEPVKTAKKTKKR